MHMLTEFGMLATMSNERQNLFGEDGYGVAFARHKLFVAKIVGKSILRGTKNIIAPREARQLDGKKVGKNVGITAVNTVHYVTDETAALVALPSIKAGFARIMPEAAASAAAVAAETGVLVGVAAALGYANMKVKESNVEPEAPVHDVSFSKRTGAVASMGIPFAVQSGFIRNKAEMMRQSVFNFGAVYALTAGGVLGAAEVAPSAPYVVAGTLLGMMAVETAYDKYAESPVAAEQLPIIGEVEVA